MIVQVCVLACVCMGECMFDARAHIHTHTKECTLVTKAETTQLSPGLFEWLVLEASLREARVSHEGDPVSALPTSRSFLLKAEAPSFP